MRIDRSQKRVLHWSRCHHPSYINSYFFVKIRVLVTAKASARCGCDVILFVSMMVSKLVFIPQSYSGLTEFLKLSVLQEVTSSSYSRWPLCTLAASRPYLTDTPGEVAHLWSPNGMASTMRVPISPYFHSQRLYQMFQSLKWAVEENSEGIYFLWLQHHKVQLNKNLFIYFLHSK